ncbi:hypothetical protein S245_059221, partial [Arachis hypogaea]
SNGAPRMGRRRDCATVTQRTWCGVQATRELRWVSEKSNDARWLRMKCDGTLLTRGQWCGVGVTTEGRSFFLEVSSEMDMGELPSNFYRRFHDDLTSLLTFADCAGNELQVLIEKSPRMGIIVNGFRNFSSFYGLKLGGWLKVSYLGSNRFIINEVIDHNMKVKEFSSPPFKVSLDIKLTVGSDSVIDISEDSSLLSSVHVKDLSYKILQPYSIHESFYTVNSTNLLPSYNNSVVPLDICLQVQSTPQILNTTHVPSLPMTTFLTELTT